MLLILIIIFFFNCHHFKISKQQQLDNHRLFFMSSRFCSPHLSPLDGSEIPHMCAAGLSYGELDFMVQTTKNWMCVCETK